MDMQDAPQLAGVHQLSCRCAVTTINDPRESAKRREQAATRPSPGKEMT
jgi:hypothetical protein